MYFRELVFVGAFWVVPARRFSSWGHTRKALFDGNPQLFFEMARIISAVETPLYVRIIYILRLSEVPYGTPTYLGDRNSQFVLWDLDLLGPKPQTLKP